MMQRALITLAILAVAAPAFGDDIYWRDVTPRLEGCWSGTGMGGEVHECWVVAEDGRADGLFLIRQDNAPLFAEIIAIDDFGEGPQMRLKHVNPDMTGWEEKEEHLTFRLLEVAPNTLTFKGLVLSLEDDDTLNIDLQMRMGDGEARTVPFRFIRTTQMIRTKQPSKLKED